ncbi:MAG: hypothetical protein ACRC6L_00190 [Steroidobacteraceae bacterium]
MRSSPAFAVSSLELPAVAAADRIAGLLVLLAALFVAWACARAGAAGWLVVALVLAGGLDSARRLLVWRRASGAPAHRLDCLDDGTLWLSAPGKPACRVLVGRGTRLLGPSVFLDLHAASPVLAGRYRYWLLPFDAPAQALRRWSVVLPHCWRVAGT